MAKYLDLDAYLTSSGKYPDRKNSPSCTNEVKTNALDLISRVNALLIDLGYVDDVDVSSGFRTPEANAHTPNSAKKSAHMSGKGIDLTDNKNQTLAKLIYGDGSGALLRKHRLMMEKMSNTVGKYTNWVHLDTVERIDRPDRSFMP